MILTSKIKPFAIESLNALEQLSLGASVITVYCGLFYISDMPQVYNSTDPNVLQADNGCKL